MVKYRNIIICFIQNFSMVIQMSKIALIIQARMSSQRLPGKMIMNIAGIPLYKYVIKRCQNVNSIHDVILATSTDSSDDQLAEFALKDGFKVFRGYLYNVLGRYIACAKEIEADIIIRVCGDSPFVDVKIIDILLTRFIKKNLDYISLHKVHCIKGLDSEIVRLSALQRSHDLNSHPDNLEHVTHYIRKNIQLFKTEFIDMNLDPFDGRISLTVDTDEDLAFCNAIANALANRIGSNRFDFFSDDIFRLIKEIQKDHMESKIC